MKIAIYVLTFITYCYSGYGSSTIAHLRDAIIAAEAIFGDVFKNFILVAKKMRTLNEVFESAVEETCIYKCPVPEGGQGTNEFHNFLRSYIKTFMQIQAAAQRYTYVFYLKWPNQL